MTIFEDLPDANQQSGAVADNKSGYQWILTKGESEQHGLTLLDIGTCWPSARIVQSRTISRG